MGKRISPAQYVAPALIVNYRDAFREANGKPAPQISYDRGWFVFVHEGRVDGRYHRVEFEQMYDRLRERALQPSA